MPSELDLTVEYTIRYTVCKKKLDVELLMTEKKLCSMDCSYTFLDCFTASLAQYLVQRAKQAD